MGDDTSIKDEDVLLRRLVPSWIIGGDQPRISSAAFQNYSGGDMMSANLESVLNQCGNSWADLLANFPDYGMASIGVAEVRSFGQGIVMNPLPDDPSHVHVEGKKGRSIRKKLANAAVLNVL